jgi:hypothetical protein
MGFEEQTMEFDEHALKRLIRVMNSVLNLYDVDGIPKEIKDYLYYPVGQLAEMLNIPVEWQKTGDVKEDGEPELEIKKFIMPENFTEWVDSSGKNDGA